MKACTQCSVWRNSGNRFTRGPCYDTINDPLNLCSDRRMPAGRQSTIGKSLSYICPIYPSPFRPDALFWDIEPTRNPLQRLLDNTGSQISRTNSRRHGNNISINSKSDRLTTVSATKSSTSWVKSPTRLFKTTEIVAKRHTLSVQEKCSPCEGRQKTNAKWSIEMIFL